MEMIFQIFDILSSILIGLIPILYCIKIILKPFKDEYQDKDKSNY
jgi:hypothetical protein